MHLLEVVWAAGTMWLLAGVQHMRRFARLTASLALAGSFLLVVVFVCSSFFCFCFRGFCKWKSDPSSLFLASSR